MSNPWIQVLDIRNTLQVIIECWRKAEKTLRDQVYDTHPNLGEVFITEHFHGIFAEKLKNASKLRDIERAFLIDLQTAFPKIGYELEMMSNGLTADVTLHGQSTEGNPGRTGGDLGLMLIRPQILDHGTHLSVSDYRRGLLVQAKLRDKNGKWREFTTTQLDVLPDKTHYLSLLLYSYSDKERRILEPFRWQICENIEFAVIKNWLSTGNFPSACDSECILNKLSLGRIGTDDEVTLDKVVCPESNKGLIVRIDWPSGKRPDDTIFYVPSSENISSHVYVRSN